MSLALFKNTFTWFFVYLYVCYKHITVLWDLLGQRKINVRSSENSFYLTCGDFMRKQVCYNNLGNSFPTIPLRLLTSMSVENLLDHVVWLVK